MVRIHGIPKFTFHTYKDQYKRGIILGIHGIEGIKCLQLSTMQVVGTIVAIIDEWTNQMPHQMHVIKQGHMDILKLIRGGEIWKEI